MIEDENGYKVNLQVSFVGNIPGGDFYNDRCFLVKNNTDSNITVQIKPANNKDFISTTLYPGWNAEICTAVKGAVGGQLQYGY